MIVTIDIGNTTISLTAFDAQGIPQLVHKVASNRNLTADDFYQQIQSFFSFPVVGSILSSVVPSLTEVVCEGFVQATGILPYCIDANTTLPLKISGYDTSNLGTDRLVDCIAALQIQKPPFALFDMGTATTLSVVDENSAFIGGMILTGLQLGVDALSANTAQLPKVSFTQPKQIIGIDTLSCMQNGALYGTACAIEGIFDRIQKQLDMPLALVLTGGMAKHILPLLQCQYTYDPHLQAKGLYYFYKTCY